MKRENIFLVIVFLIFLAGYATDKIYNHHHKKQIQKIDLYDRILDRALKDGGESEDFYNAIMYECKTAGIKDSLTIDSILKYFIL